MNPLKWIAGKLLRRQRELLCDIPAIDRKLIELDDVAHHVAGWTHALEIEAYGDIRPHPKEKTSEESAS